MDDFSIDDIYEILKEKGINTDGFDTEELMVAAFAAGVAYCFDALISTGDDITALIKEKYNPEEEF
jgi:hypothetical protein